MQCKPPLPPAPVILGTFQVLESHVQLAVASLLDIGALEFSFLYRYPLKLQT